MSGTLGDKLSRWSRLKAQAAAAAEETKTENAGESAAKPAPAAPAAAEEMAPSDGTADTPPEAAPKLPDLATLTAESDYTVFLAEGVAEETRRQALRILWRSDPVLANVSGLNDYDDDYRAIGTVQQVVETVYRAGAGYLEQLAAAADEETDGAAAPPVQDKAQDDETSS